MTEKLEPDTLVEYHGSLDKFHGLARVIGVSPYLWNDAPRYDLEIVAGDEKGEILYGARHSSLTEVGNDTAVSPKESEEKLVLLGMVRQVRSSIEMLERAIHEMS